MYEIESVRAFEVLDSRGNPTVMASVKTPISYGKAAVPSGASTGTREALELRDGGDRYMGKGVLKAVENVEQRIAPKIIGMDVRDQCGIDNLMIKCDGTEDKSDLGANTVLAVSLAVSRAASSALDVPLYRYLGRPNDITLPVPFLNVINGGEHAGNELDIQEHMIAPVGAKNFQEALRMGVEVYHVLGTLLKERYGPSATNVGDEGGYAPPINDPLDAFDLIVEAIDKTGYTKEVKIAVDTAASEFYKEGSYMFGGKNLNPSEMVDFYERLIEEYPIVSLEDPLAEDDWPGFEEITQRIGKKVQVVGDDIFVSNPKIIDRGIKENVCNAVLLKVNQIGSLTEALEAASLAMNNGYGIMVSHRSGETSDDFIADLSVALSCGQIKSGAPCRGERTSKYNRLLEIEEELHTTSNYGPNNTT
ncbi:MAG: phosphopyruvate hydratase [Thermoplasmata archaeon]